MKRVFEVLNEMVAAGVIQNYALGGAMGASTYVEAVSTEDIDIFIHLDPMPPRFSELSGVYKYLSAKGYSPRNEFVEIAGWDVQFLIPGDGSLEAEAVTNANLIQVFGVPVRVMMPEYLCAIALATRRAKDIGRVMAFIEADKVNIGDLRLLIDRFDLHPAWQTVQQAIQERQKS